jgi:hypothetical protein
MKNQSQKEKVTMPILGGALVLSVLLLALLCYWLLQLFPPNELLGQRSGDKLFRIFLLDPIPESVTILHSQDDGGFGDYILLHFKIAPDDFNLILNSKQWTTSSFASIDGYYYEDPKMRLIILIMTILKDMRTFG